MIDVGRLDVERRVCIDAETVMIERWLLGSRGTLVKSTVSNYASGSVLVGANDYFVLNIYRALKSSLRRSEGYINLNWLRCCTTVVHTVVFNNKVLRT